MKNIKIREYKDFDELKWLDIHASIMVDSAAWWTVLHKKPTYKNEVVDLVAVCDERIVGLISEIIAIDPAKATKAVIANGKKLAATSATEPPTKII